MSNILIKLHMNGLTKRVIFLQVTNQNLNYDRNLYLISDTFHIKLRANL
jgi:hypothetical protein